MGQAVVGQIVEKTVRRVYGRAGGGQQWGRQWGAMTEVVRGKAVREASSLPPAPPPLTLLVTVPAASGPYHLSPLHFCPHPLQPWVIRKERTMKHIPNKKIFL